MEEERLQADEAKYAATESGQEAEEAENDFDFESEGEEENAENNPNVGNISTPSALRKNRGADPNGELLEIFNELRCAPSAPRTF
jgi:hypothetical protein